MRNVTLAFDEQTYATGQRRARTQGVSFNAYVRQLIRQDTQDNTEWIEELFDFMDRHPLGAEGITWSREELHEL
jgi:hypothetical protein